MRHDSGLIPKAPKAFISHASEDRERFVEQFAKKLIANGVDAWTSFWEINPGDSLVSKIFETGLASCHVFIVVLSKYSFDKPWVREELDNAIVRRIEGQTKIITIRLDGCEVPESLKHVVWQDIVDLESYENQFHRILNGVFGVIDKPRLGDRPEYVKPPLLLIGELTQVDSLLFEAACRIAIETDSPFVAEDRLRTSLSGKDIPDEQLIDSENVLAEMGYIEIFRSIGPPQLLDFVITTYGLEQYVRVAIADWDTRLTQIAATLVRKQGGNHRVIAAEIKCSTFLVEHAFRVLQSAGKVKFVQSQSGGIELDVYWVSTDLKRSLEA